MIRQFPRVRSIHFGILAAASLMCHGARAKTIYVSSAQQTETRDGTSWRTAFATVPEAMAVALAGDDIWVAAGVYPAAVGVAPDVRLYGGFTGDETSTDQRDPRHNKSVLAGGINLSHAGASDKGINTVVDGFTVTVAPGAALNAAFRLTQSSATIRNNVITGLGQSVSLGGGLIVFGGSPTITRNIIRGNLAASGAGIYLSGSTALVIGNVITNNAAVYSTSSAGGGIYITGSGSPTVVSNVISGNVARSSGGGVYISGIATLRNNTIAFNSASSGGGVYSGSPQSLVLANNIVADNSSGIMCPAGATQPSLQSNDFFANAAYNFKNVTDVIGLGGNVSADPKFASTPAGDFRLLSESPLADSGDDTFVSPTDIAANGGPRIVGTHVDIGAYESNGTLTAFTPPVIRVSPQGDDRNDGASWATAKKTLQGAVNALIDGGEIWGAAGTYSERVIFGSATYLYGGFAGTEVNLADRNVTANTTTIAAPTTGPTVLIRGGGPNSCLDGFTIRDGSSNSGLVPCGIACDSASPSIVNNTIAENKGDGIAAVWGAAPVISANTIRANAGAGVYCDASSPVITRNAITDNTSTSLAGIHCLNSAAPFIANNDIEANAGGAIIASGTGLPTIICNVVTRHTTTAVSVLSAALIANNTIAGNSASTGLYCSGNAVVVNNLIAYNGTGISGTNGSLTLRNNCVSWNTSGNYSGITDPTGSNGNINLNPRLANLSQGNLRIQPDSPCRNVGDDSVVTAGETDMEGRARIQGTHVDIGAYESDGTLWPGFVVHVSPSGDNANNGWTWQTAKKTVQAGIDAASAGGGGEVWVAAGTYLEQITMKAGAAVYGGFAGTEQSRDARDYHANVTILDGNKQYPVVRAAAGVGTNDLLDGFTIRNGLGSVLTTSVKGGGVLIAACSPTIRNNTISGNTAYLGAAIYISNGSPVISNNTITGNSGYLGGGIYATLGAPQIVNNTLTANSAKTGGAMCLDTGTNGVARCNTITANTASYSGAGIALISAPSSIVDNIITANSIPASQSLPTDGAIGGGIYVSGGTPEISRNLISGNEAYSGGGLYISQSTSRVLGNTIRANTALYGGGVYAYSSAPLIANNAIAGNGAGWGGALYLKVASPSVVNNTLAGNYASAGGAACLTGGSSPSLANNIIAWNTSGVMAATGTPANIPTFRTNIFFNNQAYNVLNAADPIGANGNLAIDPLLAAPLYGNVHIQPASPARNSGDAGVVVGDTDVDGQPRVQDGAVDIGADDSDGTAWPAEPVVIRVSPNGDDANDGLTWGRARRTVQGGINAIALGGEVWVAAGTYVERVAIGPFCHVYGGFAGDETQRTQRSPSIHTTILDGDVKGTVVTMKGGAFSTLDGFTVRNGGWPDGYSGAMIGGGARVLYSAARIANNTFTGNKASMGGGMEAENAGPTIIANRFVANQASVSGYYSGGAIYLGSQTAARVVSNSFVGNAGATGSAIYAYTSAGTIANNTFYDAAPSTSGIGSAGAHSTIYIGYDSRTPGPIITIANNIIALSEQALTLGDGTAPYVSIRNNCVWNNTRDYYGIAEQTGKNGNIKADPELADPTRGNLHVQPTSPCRDAGDGAVLLDSETDMDGQPRLQGAAVDIGADESDLSVWSPSSNVVRVKPEGDDANDGSSWQTAKRTVQGGIDGLGAVGGNVWVAAGTYNERVSLRAFVHLLGGFSGTETDSSQRNWSAFPTRLDGGQAGPVVQMPFDAIFSVLDGFTIGNGRVVANGGGVLAQALNVEVAHNIIVGNSASYGGGIAIASISALIHDNVIAGNTATDSGGGLYVSASTVNVVNNTITGNFAPNGAGAYGASGTPTLVNNIIAFNQSGIANPSTGTSPFAWSRMRNNDLFGNGADYVNINDQTGINSNVRFDPRFVNTASGDWRLQATSLLIDAGDDASVVAGSFDLDKQPRIRANHVDIGAYEADGPPISTGPPIVRVSSSGNDANDGATWATALKTVQAAINSVRSPGGEVWVAAGAYVERLVLRPGVSLYGGFAGTEADRDHRNTKANTTVLDGDAKGSVLVIPAGCGLDNEVDGFVIRNGSGDFTLAGGGILSAGGSPTIRNNVITDNVSSQGGGIFVNGGSPSIQLNTIEGNAGGGGIETANASPLIERNLITGNYSNYAGGIRLANGEPVVRFNTIVSNAGVYCGGVAVNGGTAVLTNNRIARNTAESAGGGIRATFATVTVANNQIVGNRIIPSTSGTTYTQGAAGVYLSASTAVLTNNTIAANGGSWGAIETDASTLTAVNNIVAFNSRGISRPDKDTSAITLRSNDFFANSIGDYMNVADATGVDGNFKADPRFVDIAHGDVHIQPDSAARDAGDNSAEVGDVDIDSQPRVQNGQVDIGCDESDGLVHTAVVPVVRVSPAGNDANDGSDWANAKRTIQAAVNSPESGVEVWAAAGVYNERVTMGSFTHLYGGFVGTETERDQRDWRANRTVVDGSDQTGTAAVLVSQGALYTTVDGITARMGGTGIYVDKLASASVSNNVAQDNYNGGITAANVQSVVISGNRVTGNRSGVASSLFGGAVWASGGVVIVANNVLAGNTAQIAVRISGTQASFVNNTVVSNSGFAVETPPANVVVANNIIAFNRRGVTSNYDYYKTTPDVWSHNCVFGNTEGDYVDVPAPTGANADISVDPRLADASSGDLHIQPASPCRDAGDSSFAYGSSDAGGCPRVQGPTIDIGAYESDGLPVVPVKRIIRVKPDGDDTLDGTTWAKARRTIQSAAHEGCEVWVAAGMYEEYIKVGPFVALYGGFRGDETERQERLPGRYETVVDGKYLGNTFTVRGGFDPVVIDGFTIVHGGSQDGWPYGGGIYVESSVASILNNVIADDGPSGIAAYYSTVEIRNNIVQGAISQSWAAINLPGSSGTIQGNLIRWNNISAIAAGAGVSVIGNTLYQTGGITLDAAPGRPGAILRNLIVSGAINVTGDDLVVANNLVYANTADGRNDGISAWGANALVANNTIVDNSSYSYGTALSVSGTGAVTANNIIAFDTTSTTYVPAVAVEGDFRNNCVYGNTIDFKGADLVGTQGNIRREPLFADRAVGNYTLLPGSPCIDTGDQSILARIGAYDLYGNPRQAGESVDMGAIEWTDSLPVPARLRTYVSPVGDNEADGLTWATAKRTVQGGVDALALGGGGGEVWVAAGTYPGNVRIEQGVNLFGGFKGGETDLSQRDYRANVTTIVSTHDAAVYRVPGTLPSAIDGFTIRHQYYGVYVSTSNVTIAHNTVIGSNVPGAYGFGIVCSEGSATILDNDVSASSQYGIYVSNSSAAIRGNRVHNNPNAGIGCYATTFLVDGNTVTANAGPGIRVTGKGIVSNNAVTNNVNKEWYGSISIDGPGVTVVNNLIAGNTSVGGAAALRVSGGDRVLNNTIVSNSGGAAGTGVVVGGDSAGIFANNVVAYNSGGFQSESGASQPTFRNNCAFGNGPSYIGWTDPTGTGGNIAVDPVFVDPGQQNYRLASGSPCIDNGENAYAPAALTDLAGVPRIQGTSVDIGAYESGSAPAYTFADVVAALRVAGGLTPASPEAAARLDAGSTPRVITLEDAAVLIRSIR